VVDARVVVVRRVYSLGVNFAVVRRAVLVVIAVFIVVIATAWVVLALSCCPEKPHD